MSLEIIDEELNKPSIFKDETKLSIDHVPSKLPHRENAQRKLTQIFRGLIIHSGQISQRVIITGGVGVGKTAVTKSFGNSFAKFSQKRGVNLHYVHINCRKNQTEFMVLKNIVHNFAPSIPDRGFSPEELFQILINILSEKDIYLLLTLDELDSLLLRENGAEFLYKLTRITDEHQSQIQRVSFIGIVKNVNLIKKLDDSTTSTLQHNVLYFQNYTSNQLFDVLKARVKDALYHGVISNDTIRLISDIASEWGDARYSIELLWRAGKFADEEGKFKIIPEYVRHAKSETHPVVRKEVLRDLHKPQKVLLVSLSRLLKRSGQAFVTTGELENAFKITCEEYNIQPKKHTQLWDYINEIKQHNIIETKISGKGMRGKTTLISLPDIKAEVLENETVKLLEKNQE
ncbi:MAG: ORC1-type DNA replication protein [Candidatus Ranarchaeia archaeon]